MEITPKARTIRHNFTSTSTNFLFFVLPTADELDNFVDVAVLELGFLPLGSWQNVAVAFNCDAATVQT